jgi:phosphoribosylamine--glycine ligase
VVTPELHARIMREVITPTVEGMAADGIRFTGFLYAGIMVGADGAPKVLEFNCRMGDPETQPIMMRLKSDFVTIVEAAINGTLDQVDVEWDRRTALAVVLAAAGYPDTPTKGAVINIPPAAIADDLHVFHAGTMTENGQTVVSGGRVLAVTALGDSVRMAQKRAYDAIASINFDGMQYRRDIGWRALDRKK